MHKMGLTSVTFRQLPAEDIVTLCAACGGEGIEWGGDVHVPQGDLENAARIKALTEAAGLQVFSYGSYYRLCTETDFAEVLSTAEVLGAPMIRVWAGALSSLQASADYAERAADELRAICAAAKERGIAIGLEYHRGTLTDTAESTLSLLKGASCPNLFTYWQPNPDLSQAERLLEISCLLPYIRAVHTFYWTTGDVRRPLAEGLAEWQQYAAMLRDTDCPYILEFVQGDSAAQYEADAAALRELLL